MHPIPPLDTLGRRICICGPSNAGKSTLAAAIGRKLAIPAVHLDQFRHLPNTDWVQRSDGDFTALHDEAILGAVWVMDGNYSALMPQRMARATGIILLGSSNRWVSLFRYFRRTLFERERAGHLEGAQDSIKWLMIHWIVFVQPKRRKGSVERARSYGLPLLELDSMAELKEVYRVWGLRRR